MDGAVWAEGDVVRVAPGHVTDVHASLAQYPYSSYHYYLGEQGEEFLTNAWLSYPIPNYVAHDDFGT